MTLSESKGRLFITRLNDAGLPVGDPIEVYGVSGLTISMEKVQPVSETYSYAKEYTVNAYMHNVPQEVKDLMAENLDWNA